MYKQITAEIIRQRNMIRRNRRIFVVTLVPITIWALVEFFATTPQTCLNWQMVGSWSLALLIVATGATLKQQGRM